MDSLRKLMDKAELLRPGYPASIGYETTGCKDPIALVMPPCIEALYRYVDGTPHQIANQALMDFLPNYRIIHRDELKVCREQAHALCDDCFPLFADYSGNFICVSDSKLVAVDVVDPEPTMMFNSLDDLFVTQIQFYEENVYSLNSHGFLESDYATEGEVGSRLNPQCAYWTD